MRLNSLEVKGFKSFGDKVTIHFDKGVTAIVGPNGSGKSNVVDAMRWVLGEQKTRMLRSDKMENIIFNGTKTRSQANLAEVTLTFENTKNILATQYSTIAICRKLYRDGTSEFYLNNVQCRLKDVTDLFLDTGIGPDSYSIIELKMVDDILNDRNNTIKTLLEEAAGISKYKIRKKQTLQRLEETDSDLNRVNDLMFEIEKSLKQLESQAKKAEKFNRIKGDYKEFSIALALFNIHSYRVVFDELQKREQQQQDEKLKYVSQIDTMEAAIQHKKTNVLEKEKSLSASQKLLNEKLIIVSNAENEKKSLTEKINQLKEKQIRLVNQNESDLRTLSELALQIEKLISDKVLQEELLIKMTEELDVLKLNSDSLREQFATSQEELKELNNSLFQTRQELNQHETKLAVKQTRFESLNAELRRINEQNQLSIQKISHVEKELQQVIPQKEIYENELSILRLSKVEYESTIKTTEEQLKGLKAQLLDESRKADAKGNEYQLTKNMLEQLDGYPESIRFLKTSHDKSKKAPLLSDVISCKEEYKVAIENYLEPFLNYFIVENSNDALEAVSILSESAQGRANFFVLDSFRSQKEELPAKPNGSANALEVVEFDRKYEHLFKHLLGHVFIMEDSKAVGDYFIGNEKRIVLLTSKGNLIKQRYSLAGGSIGLFDGKRTGKLKNLSDMEELIKSLTASVENFQSLIIDKEEIYNLASKQLKETNSKLHDAEVNLSKTAASFTSINNNKAFLQSGIDSYKKTIDKLEEEIKLLTEENAEASGSSDFLSEQLRAQVMQLMDDQKTKQEKATQLQTELSDASNKFNQHNIAVIQQQNKIHGIERELNFKTGQQLTLTTNLTNNKSELDITVELIDKLTVDFSNSETTLIGLLDEKNVFEKELTQNETEYYKAKGDIDQEERSINEIRKQKENCDGLIQQVHDQVNELKLQLNSMKERMQVEFSVDINELLTMEPDEQTTEAELQAKVEKIKKQIQEFGPVNPMALEQFKEIKERHDFIFKEQEDLRNAKASLLLTINEIDTTAHEKFMNAFINVRENFIRVFRSLFTAEDRCDLILDTPDNPLESDITIVAQPKGKKPLTIQQLSGGEKTLTATALLFGIYLLKPAPFCIFDEVDAPLDDNNVDKFINIIQSFSNETQFIVITHNKRTMTATDVIYGITMAEQGVTQVVPVDMREFAAVA